MRCFIHQDQEAVGVCAWCLKGLCPGCAADQGYGLACKGVHEPQVEAARTIVLRAARAQRLTLVRYLLPAFLSIFGIAFLIEASRAARPEFPASMGAVFLLFGLTLLIFLRRVYARTSG